MEGQSNSGFDGTQVGRTQVHNIGPSTSSLMQLPGYILRITAIVLTFVSTIVMGVAKEPVAVIETENSGQTVNTYVGSIRTRYSSAFVYFIVVNVIVFIYSVISLAMTLLNRGGLRRIAMHLSIADLVMVILLFSSNGAAAAISVVADKGVIRFAWPRFCYALHKFCGHIKAAIVLSMFASMAYMLLIGLAIIDLHMRSR